MISDKLKKPIVILMIGGFFSLMSGRFESEWISSTLLILAGVLYLPQ